MPATKFVNTYRELQVFKPVTMRGRLRNIALSTIAGGFDVLNNMEALFSRPRIQFLYIHHVFQDEEKKLTELLKFLSRHHVFISYSEAVKRIWEGNIDKPYICISSDDGLKNNLAAAAIAGSFGASACFFICPSVIGEQDPDKIREFSGVRLHFPPVEFMSWEDVDDLLKQGHEIGGHTMSHVNIAATPTKDLVSEIAGCYDVLREKCGDVQHFAYPYGLFTDFTEHARQLVFQSGFKSIASAQRGCHIPKLSDLSKPVGQRQGVAPENLLIRRDHVILSWPLRHILYFIARNARTASEQNNFFPGL